MALSGDTIARLEAAHFAADLDHLATEFMSDRHRHRDRLPCPRVPVIDVHVGAADRGLADADQDVVMTHARLGNLFHPDAGFGARFDQCFHVRRSVNEIHGPGDTLEGAHCALQILA